MTHCGTKNSKHQHVCFLCKEAFECELEECSKPGIFKAEEKLGSGMPVCPDCENGEGTAEGEE